MKKTIIIVIIIAALGALIYFHDRSTTKIDINKDTTTAAGHPDMSNATFIVENENLALKSGSNTSPIAPGSDLTVETKLTDIEAYGDISGDGKEDTVGLLIQSGAGSGIFVYLVGYVSAPVAYKGTNGIFVGDRISPQSLSISNGVITLKYLDRKDDEAFAEEPTLEMTRQFVYKSGELQVK